MIKIYTNKEIMNMSPLEIVIYSIVGIILVGLLFKWFIYDKYIKPKRKNKKEDEEDEDS